MKKNSTLFVIISLISVMALVQGCKKATVPELTTVAISDITLTTAVSGGNITSDGGEEILQKGVCWSTTQSPTIASSITNDGNGSTAYTSNLVGLTAGTTYYVRAYATNSVGTAYGDELTFPTNEVTAAVVTTTEVTTVTSVSAIAGGNVTDAGGGTISARGICWGTSANPTIAGNKTTSGTGPGVIYRDPYRVNQRNNILLSCLCHQRFRNNLRSGVAFYHSGYGRRRKYLQNSNYWVKSVDGREPQGYQIQ